MKSLPLRVVLASGVAGLIAAASYSAPAMSHHSFAMYTDALVFTAVGVVSSVNPDANHQTIDFAVINADRNNYVYRQVRDPDTGEMTPYLDPSGNQVPVTMRVEMAGAGGAAGNGVTVARFANGSVISTAFFPLRSMLPLGAGIQGGTEGGSLIGGRGGGDGTGNNTASLSICPQNPETGRYVIPGVGEFCDQLEGAFRTNEDETIGDIMAEEPAVEWAAWAFGDLELPEAPEAPEA